MNDLYEAARHGDQDEVRRLLNSGVRVDQPDEREGYTALMVACMSDAADVDTLKILIDAGADVNALAIPTPLPSVDYSSLLESKYIDEETREVLQRSQVATKAYTPEIPPLIKVVAGRISREKLAFLIAHGVDVNAKSSHGYTAALVAAGNGRLDVLDDLLAAGASIDGITSYGESAVNILSRDACFEDLGEVLKRGADPAPLGWSALAHAVVFGDLEEVGSLIATGGNLEQTDAWGRTPFLLTVHAGDVTKAALLLEKGANRDAQGRCQHGALSYAARRDHEPMLRWLLEQGFPPDVEDEFQCTPLMDAAEAGAVQACRILLEGGANLHHRSHIEKSVIGVASDPAVIRLLLDHGANLEHLEPEALREYIGLGNAADLPVTRDEFHAGRQRRFGTANPERMDIPFWKAMVRCGWSGYSAGDRFDFSSFGRGEPVWCHQRFGMSITPLPDGRFVQIAGEHEDSYDPDFCIYNEVIVHDGKGGFEILGYPEEVFPPTDFHSATLVGSWIYILGNLGYHTARGDRMPVYRYHIENGGIERVETSGETPGWVYGHEATLHEGRIRISGGKIALLGTGGPSEIKDHADIYWFDPATGVWEKPASGF